MSNAASRDAPPGSYVTKYGDGTLGFDPKKNRAIGEWLDMYGNRWKRNREAGWTLIEGR